MKISLASNIDLQGTQRTLGFSHRSTAMSKHVPVFAPSRAATAATAEHDHDSPDAIIDAINNFTGHTPLQHREAFVIVIGSGLDVDDDQDAEDLCKLSGTYLSLIHI